VTQPAPRILKKGAARVAGACRLGTPAGARPAAGGPEARLVERHDDRAVIEVRCACGRFAYVECRWPKAAPPAPPAPAAKRNP